jgi:hypothetical protein
MGTGAVFQPEGNRVIKIELKILEVIVKMKQCATKEV